MRERIPRHNLGKVKARRYLSKSFSLHTSAQLKEHAGKTMNAFTEHRFSKAAPLARRVLKCVPTLQLWADRYSAKHVIYAAGLRGFISFFRRRAQQMATARPLFDTFIFISVAWS